MNAEFTLVLGQGIALGKFPTYHQAKRFARSLGARRFRIVGTDGPVPPAADATTIHDRKHGRRTSAGALVVSANTTQPNRKDN